MQGTLASSKMIVMMLLLAMICANLGVNQGFAAPEQSSATPLPASDQSFCIGFHFWKSGKIYDEAYQGIIDSLALEKISFQPVVMNSQLNREMAQENLLAMDRMKLSCIVSMSSEGTQIAQAMKLETPVIAAVINHPLSLGIIEKNRSNENLTGLSYFIDPEKQLQLFQKLFPGSNHFGMIYDKNNPAGFLAEEPLMAKACKKLGIRFTSVGIVGRDDIAEGAEKMLADKVELLIVPTNLEVYGNLGLILEQFYSRKIPIVSLNKQGVDNGALAALFADNYKLGRMAGPMFRSILIDHTPASAIPIAMIDEPDLIINLSAANSLDYEFPPDILVSAAIVLQ
ncbi:MAG: hypothetical protein KJ630_05960 [Proteobacteria bacterium]|nr:hypothetical protein [Pseudomonadota bacterium]